MVQEEVKPNYGPPLCPCFINRNGGSLGTQQWLEYILRGVGRWEKVLQEECKPSKLCCTSVALPHLVLELLAITPRIISRAGFIDIVDSFEQYSGTISNQRFSCLSNASSPSKSIETS